jgi:hypothetical protein
VNIALSTILVYPGNTCIQVDFVGPESYFLTPGKPGMAGKWGGLPEEAQKSHLNPTAQEGGRFLTL